MPILKNARHERFAQFTVKMTWAEIVAFYRLKLDRAPHNLQSRYNVCPTDPVDVVTERDGQRDFVRMRWGLVPWWWDKPLKPALQSSARRPSPTSYRC
jgi:putative SOS response-associated peptidase YedK